MKGGILLLKYLLFAIGIILALIFALQDIRSYLRDKHGQAERHKRIIDNFRFILILPGGYFTYVIKYYVFSYVYIAVLLSIICIPNFIIFLICYKRNKRKEDLVGLVLLAVFYLSVIVPMTWFYCLSLSS